MGLRPAARQISSHRQRLFAATPPVSVTWPKPAPGRAPLVLPTPSLLKQRFAGPLPVPVTSRKPEPATTLPARTTSFCKRRSSVGHRLALVMPSRSVPGRARLARRMLSFPRPRSAVCRPVLAIQPRLALEPTQHARATSRLPRQRHRPTFRRAVLLLV